MAHWELLTHSSATHEGAGEEGASDPAEPQQAGEYLEQTQIIIVSFPVIYMLINAVSYFYGEKDCDWSEEGCDGGGTAPHGTWQHSREEWET